MFRNQARSIGLVVALGLALAVLAVFSPSFMTLDNFVVLAMQMSFIGIASIGTAQLMISGNIDLSVGALFALTAVVSAMLATMTHPLTAMVAAIALGGVIGLVNGAIVWRIRISPIIGTLGSMAVLRGCVLLLTGGYSVRGVPQEFSAVGQARWWGVPTPVWALFALAVAAHWVLTRTTVGRHIFAIGGNREACLAAGIPVQRLVLGSFAVNGFIAGVAGVLAASRFGSASPSFGATMELDVITAVILGGVAFKGGEGNILGVMLAVALLGVINSGIVSLGIDPHFSEIAKGAALIIAISLDQFLKEARERYQTLLAMREA